ncbi:MAG: GNAT family N-acetyltransferase [Vibrio sp.]
MDYQIRLVQAGDEWLLNDFYSQNKAHLTPWEPARAANFYSVEHWCERIAVLLQAHERQIAFSFVILDQNEQQVLGVINYTSVSGYPLYACNLGYALAESAQHKGIMRSALAITNGWMFEQMNLHRIMACYIPRNLASEKVLKSLNFQHEGTAQDYLLINGKWETHHLTSLVNPNWTSNF